MAQSHVRFRGLDDRAVEAVGCLVGELDGHVGEAGLGMLRGCDVYTPTGVR